MGKRIYCLAIIALALISFQKASAQTVETGHEVLRGEFNFAALADSYAHHPPALIEKERENEEDEPHPLHPPITDPTLIRRWSPPTSMAPGFAAFSPAPTDTFESTLDNNTAVPPDTHGAVDSNYCMTTINTDVRIQKRDGTVLSTVSLDAFFSSVVSGGTFDPRCHYDIATHRWIVVADAGAQSASSALLIAISKTSNPTGAWWTYSVTAYAPGDYWLDFPDVGFNSKWIAISGNLFANSGSGYNGCKMFVFNKASLLSGAGAPFTAFTQASSECICPAITYDATETSIFAIENYNGGAGGGGQLHMWKITGLVGSEAMTSVGFPASTGFNWQGQAFAVSAGGADFAPQAGTSNLVQTNDDRIAQVVFMNGKLWCSHNVFLPYSTTVDPTRSSVQWWQMDSLGTPIQVGVVDDPTSTNFYAFPSIAVNTSNDAIMGFSAFSATTHPSAAYAVHLHTDAASTMESLDIFRHGTNTYFKTDGGTRDRWGDYSAACIDPLNQTDFWTLQEASANPSNTFDTWWAYVKPCNPPGAIITPVTSTSFCTGGSVILNANTGSGYTYQWEAGGSPIAGATASSFTASTGGSYTVIVTVVTCTDTSTSTAVTVSAPPTATITPVGSTTLCVGGSVTLNANTGVGLTYQWLSGGSPIAGATTSTYVAVTTGSVTVTVTNAGGCSTTSAVTDITIGIAPPATITPVGSTTFCSGSSLVLNANIGVGLTYQWQSSGSPIGGATNSSYTTLVGGTFSVVVTNASGCSTTSSGVGVIVNPTPSAIAYPGTAVVCSGATLSMSDGTPGGSWTSSIPTVATVSGSGLVTGVGSGGLTTIAYTASGCAATVVVTVNSTSLAAITGSTAVCVGQTVPLSDVTPSGTWTSSNPAAATIGSSSGSLTGVAPGSTTITYSVSGACGSASVTRVISVSTPIAVAPITGAFAICSGTTTPLADVTPAGVWSSSNLAVSTVSPGGIVTGIASGVDTIFYSVTNLSGCVSNAKTPFTVSSSFAATITPLGATSFCTGGSVVLSASTGTGYSYQWQRGGASIAGATSSTYTASAGGNYTVTITLPGGCNATSAPVTVIVNPTPIFAPSVNIFATAGPIFCLTTSSATFSAVPDGRETTPLYQWSVNGSAVSAAPSFTYTPAAGDRVTVTMTSSVACAFPLTVSHTDTIVVSPLQAPEVTMVSAPAVICSGTNATFTAVPVFGGIAPFYRWNRNGVNVATGAEYIYSPANGDIVKVEMVSDYPCISPDSVSSPSITVHTITSTINSVTVIASESSVVAGSVDTFVAIAPNGGSSPAYQWVLNGAPIVGATSSLYITSSLIEGDVVRCQVTSDQECASPTLAESGGVSVKVVPVGVQQVSVNGNNFTLVPNPNKGEFTIEGDMKNQSAHDADIAITDMLGQVVYKTSTNVQNGKLSVHVTMDASLANGSYLVSITSGSDHVVYHIVVNK